MKIWLKNKRCPRCGGNLYLEADAWGRWFKKCLLCAREFDLTVKEKREFGRV